MLVALRDGQRVKATPKTRAACPECESEMVAKCGTKVTWHWAHKVTPDPLRHDSWKTGPETEFHLRWKDVMSGGDPSCLEVRITDPETGVWHIADVLVGGWVVEVQHSPLSREDVEKRESFYTKHATGMIWITDREDLPHMTTQPTFLVGEGQVFDLRHTKLRWTVERFAFRAAGLKLGAFLSGIEAWLEKERQRLEEERQRIAAEAAAQREEAHRREEARRVQEMKIRALAEAAEVWVVGAQSIIREAVQGLARGQSPMLAQAPAVEAVKRALSEGLLPYTVLTPMVVYHIHRTAEIFYKKANEFEDLKREWEETQEAARVARERELEAARMEQEDIFNEIFSPKPASSLEELIARLPRLAK